MEVQQVKNGIQVEPDHVYVIPPGSTMTFTDGSLKLNPKGKSLRPIDAFLRSLATGRKAQAIGIVLSGTGNDGTEGLKAIKVEDGITFAQDPNTAQYPDMPKNAIAAEAAYFVLAPEQIAKEIINISKHPQLTRHETKAPEKEKVETDLKKIIAMLKTSFGVDFTHYRETTINRRITRRMVINNTENIKAYIEFLRAHQGELQALFDDLLIGVTSFFREPDTFLALKEKVFPNLVQNKSPKESIRVWVPGCSTGEEVYSFAIAIQEFLEEKAISGIRIQIFGTDANEKNIEKARQGTYPKSIEDNVSQNRLKRFFTSYNGHYRIAKSIRDMCIFAKQDITTDPPFSNIDLIICRNVLIYFDSYLHERVLPIFHYGLKPNGFLVLGESESVGKFQYLFEPFSPKGLIYRKKQAHPQAVPGENIFVPYAAKRSDKPLAKADLLTVLGEKVDHLIKTEYCPATLLVNNNLDILVFRGEVAPYLSPESGAASLNITKIIRKEVRSQVQTAVYRARKEKKAIKETVCFKQKGQPKAVNIEIRPIITEEYNEPFYVVLFSELASQDTKAYQENKSEISPIEIETLKNRQIRELREDLEATKQSLQTLFEGQEATNEELRSSMEEVQSSNEELQSTNEELETAKEELQSGNEELQTLNEELKNRNLALGHLNDDLANLQTNVDLPVIIVDNELKIRRLTVSAQKLLKISPSDVGRSITDFNVGSIDLGKTISNVLTKLTADIQEVACGEDRLCEMQIRPYLTEEKKIDGAVVSFMDVTDRKKAESALRESEQRYRTLFSNMEEGFFLGEPILDRKGKPVDYRILEANSAFEKQTGLKVSDLLGKTIKEALPGLEESWIQTYCKVALTGKPVHFEDYNSNTQRYYEVYSFSPTKERFASLFIDITERVKLQNKLKEYNENLEKLVEERTKQLKDSECLATIGATAGMVGHDIRNPLQAITSDLYLAKMDLLSFPESEEKKTMQESLEEIEKNISYISKIVADLQDFAKPLSPKLEETDFEQAVHSALANLNIPPNITVKQSIGKDFPKLKTDQAYLQRILTNLTNNSIQAMPKGGKVTIKAVTKNGNAIISVEDNGEGIPERIRSKLFTPLMTTKSKGQGFGLSVVKRFTEALGGKVTFETEVGKGTKFLIELPI